MTFVALYFGRSDVAVRDSSFLCVNPSIAYMVLTARAVDYAVAELNRRNL